MAKGMYNIGTGYAFRGDFVQSEINGVEKVINCYGLNFWGYNLDKEKE